MSDSLKKFLCLTLFTVACGCGGPDSGAPAADDLSSGSATGIDDGLTDSLLPEPEVSERFELGTHYLRLTPTQPTRSGPEVVELTEVFSYTSAASYEFATAIDGWARSAPAYVYHRRMPDTRTPTQKLHARAFYTAAGLERSEELHNALYREVQQSGNPLDSIAAVAAFFQRQGVQTQTFDERFNSFEVYEAVERAGQYVRRYRINALPSYVVNGKYLTTPQRAGSREALIALIRELTASEHTPE